MGTIKDRNSKDLTEAEEIKKRWQGYTEELYKKRYNHGGLVTPLEFFIELFSFLGISGWGIDLYYCDVEWFSLVLNQDHYVDFETAPKYCISDIFVEYEGYYISSKGFLPTVVDIMVI